MINIREKPVSAPASPVLSTYDNNSLINFNVDKREKKLLKSIADFLVFILLSAFYITKAIYKYFLPSFYTKYKDLKGEISLITGGGSGLGRLLALRLGKLGATVVLWDISTEGLQETINIVEAIGGTAYGYKCDVSKAEEVYAVARKTEQEVGDVTLLINNAGVVSGGFLLNTPDHLIKRTFDVNIVAHFWTVKAFLPKMIEKKHGHIVTIASMAGHVGINKLVDYCSSKFAAVGFDEALRVELESQGVKSVMTTVICPYFIQATGMFDAVDSRFLPRLRPNYVADRIIDAIRSNATMVLIPNGFKWGLMLKTFVPWTVISLFLRGLVPDAVPESTSIDNIQQSQGHDEMFSGRHKNGYMTESMSLETHGCTLNDRML